MNCVVAGTPGEAAVDVAGALLAARPGAPVTLLSDDTVGLLAVLDRPELVGCEVLWADASSPGTVDDALVHRRMLHGRPDVVVLVVDEPADEARERALVRVLAPRLGGTPLLVTGPGAATLSTTVDELLRDLADDTAHAPVCVVLPASDPDDVLQEAARLVSATPVPAATRPLLHGHCAH